MPNIGYTFQGGAKGLVVGVYDKNKKDDAACIELSPAAYKMDERNGGKIINALNGYIIL